MDNADNNYIDNEEEEEEEEEFDEEAKTTKKKKKRKKKKVLTDFEKAKIKETVKEMKKNQVQPQKIIGKKDFDKPGFVSNPSKIIYRDFEIGKKMSLKIEIINVSYVFNSFHLQPLDDDIIDFFEIDYKPSGRIPAGISTEMTLHFTPLVNKDYISSLKLLSETGMCVIPIECYCKKCIINFEKNVLDYGEVILGQEITLPLAVSNTGALDCKYSLTNENKDLLTEIEEEEEKDVFADIDPSYKDFTDRKIILHKYDYARQDEKCGDGIIDKIRAVRVKEYKEKAIKEAREKYEREEKEKEEAQLAAQQVQSNDKNSKQKSPPKPVKKPAGGKDKEPQAEFVEGMPKEIYDETLKQVIEYENNFKIENKEDQDFYNEELRKNQDETMKNYLIRQLRYPLHGMFSGYSKKNVPIVLNARFIGTFEMNVLMKIEYKNETEYKKFTIKFNVVDLPLYSEKKVYEFNYIIINEIFREKIVLVNNSSIPYKLQMFHHKDISEFIEINPNLGYIQANSTFDVWIKLKVNSNIKKLINFFKGKNSEDDSQDDNPKNNEYNFPLKIVLNNIAIPLITLVHFWVTTDTLKINEKLINYGRRFLDEATGVKISLNNLSDLPLKYGFIMLPKEFTVVTNIDSILSKEKIFANIIYESKDNFVGHREGDIFCKVVTSELTTQNIKLKYHIELVKPDITISPKKIDFQALPENESEELRLTIFNKTDKNNYVCEFLTPPKCISGLTIMPKVFELKAQGYNTCVIKFDSAFREYNAFSSDEVEKEKGFKLSDGIEQLEKDVKISGIENKQLEEKVRKEIENTLDQAEGDEGGKKGKKGGGKAAEAAKKPDPKKADAKKDKKQIEEEELKRKEEEEQRIRDEELKKQQRIQNFNKEEELKYFGAETTFINKEGNRSCHWRFVIPLYYKILNDKNSKMNGNNNANTSPLNISYLEVNTTCVEKVLTVDQTEIDFGEVSVNNRKTINLVVTNTSNKIAKLKMKPLIVMNCFRIVNAVRDLKPKSSFIYIVEFLPLKDLPYFDDFILYTGDTQTTVHLRGIGVKPEVEVSLPDGILYLGNTMVNNTIENTFEIENKSTFKINYEFKVLKSGKNNKTGLKPFCYVPYCGDLEAKEKRTITVTFKGDHQDYENYYEFLLLDVPNQKKINKIFVMARCWERQVYWKEFTEIIYPDDKFLGQIIEQDPFVTPLNLISSSKSTNNTVITLIFIPESQVKVPDFVQKKAKEKEKDESKSNSGKNKKIKSGNKSGKGKGKTSGKKKAEETEPEINDVNEKCFKRKLVIGNCKLDNAKDEKNGAFEVFMDKDCPYFGCDNLKGAVNSGQEIILNFSYKKPDRDPLIKDIACLKGIGMWIESKVEVKISGGFVEPGKPDAVSFYVILKAYVEQI